MQWRLQVRFLDKGELKHSPHSPHPMRITGCVILLHQVAVLILDNRVHHLLTVHCVLMVSFKRGRGHNPLGAEGE